MSHDDHTDSNVSCEHCNREGLHWEKRVGGWKLCHFNGDIHVCAREKPRMSAAEVAKRLEAKG